MRYHPPAGSALPNAPYVGKNIALQQQGSRIPPQVPEYTQREIVNVVELSAQVPTDDDLTQLARAIRLAGLQTFTDTSATPGYITVGSPLAVAGYAAGMPFSVTAAVGFIAVSGVATLNGLVLMQAIRERLEAGDAPLEAATTGAANRLRAVLTRQGSVPTTFVVHTRQSAPPRPARGTCW